MCRGSNAHPTAPRYLSTWRGGRRVWEGRAGGRQIICLKTANGKRALSLTSRANTCEAYLFILLPSDLHTKRDVARKLRSNKHVVISASPRGWRELFLRDYFRSHERDVPRVLEKALITNYNHI